MVHDGLIDGLLLALQLPQRMGHTNIGVGFVVPAGGFVAIAVVAAQQGVDVVCTRAFGYIGFGAGNHREIGWQATEPFFGLLRIDVGFHRFTHFFSGEEQVVFDLLLSQANIFQAVVAHKSCAVAVQAVINEDFGTVLQGGHVSRFWIGFVPSNAFTGSKSTTE